MMPKWVFIAAGAFLAGGVAVLGWLIYWLMQIPPIPFH